MIRFRAVTHRISTGTSSFAAGQQFLGLDGLGGVASLIVVIWHAQALFGYAPASGYLPSTSSSSSAVFMLGALRPVFDLVTVIAVFPLLVATAAVSEPRFLSRLYARLGSASYAVYILHVPTLAIVLGILSKMVREHALPSGTLIGGAFVVCVLATASFADVIYDIPIRRLLLRRNRAFQERAAPPS